MINIVGIWTQIFKPVFDKKKRYLRHIYGLLESYCQHAQQSQLKFFSPSLLRLLLGSTQEKWSLGWLARGCQDIACLETQSTSRVVQKLLAKREKLTSLNTLTGKSQFYISGIFPFSLINVTLCLNFVTDCREMRCIRRSFTTWLNKIKTICNVCKVCLYYIWRSGNLF